MNFRCPFNCINVLFSIACSVIFIVLMLDVWKKFQEHTNRSFAEHFEWHDKHRVPPTVQVPREFLPFRPEAGPPTVSQDAPHRRAGLEIRAEESGSGLPSGSGREERGGESPRDRTIDKRELFSTDELHGKT